MHGWSLGGLMCIAIDVTDRMGNANMHIGGTTIPVKFLSPIHGLGLDGSPKRVSIGQLWPLSKQFQRCVDGEYFSVCVVEESFSRIFVSNEFIDLLFIAAVRDARFLLRERST